MENNEILRKIEKLEKEVTALQSKRKGMREYLKDAFRKTNVLVGIGLAAIVTGAGLYAAQVTFVDGTIISAEDVNANFTELYNDITGLKSKGYMKLGMSNSQSVNNGDTISFDTVRYSNNLSSSSNGVSLTAGKTYRLEACLNLYSGSGLAGYLGYRFYANSTAIGNEAYSQPVASSSNFVFKAGLVEIYTPLTDVVLTIRVIDDNIGTGVVTPYYGTYFMVTEL